MLAHEKRAPQRGARFYRIWYPIFMAGRFVHLHTHSHYSFLQALPKVPDLVKAAKKNHMDTLALTDATNLHGAIEFYKKATKEGVKPILGVDTYVAPRSRFEQDPHIDTKRSRIVLLAENNTGYRNLVSLVTQSFTEGFFERARVDMELLGERNNGIIALIPSFAGNVAQMLKAGDKDGAAAALAEYKSIFGTNNLFLEISHHPKVAGHTETMKKIAELSRESGVPLVAQQDVYYLSPDDREATEVMRRIQHGERGYHEEEDFSFTTEKQMLEYFKDIPEAVDLSRKIADRCDVSFELGSWVFPDFPVPEGSTHVKELRAKTERGLAWRGMKETPEIRKRIDYELDIIITKGFAPYFLVVSDLLNHAKEIGILTTTRGSAAGSVVSYLTGITNVDPIAYQLPFERFLNPERPKAPDIDMDYADLRRDEMISYAKEKYGDDKVAQIGTFGTMMARAAVRDVARALGHPYGVGDHIAKLIPMGSQGFPMTIDHAMEIEPDLQSLYTEDDDVHEILDIAKRIEGCARQTGVHAAGVVIAPTPLNEWTPVQPDPKGTGKLITQYDMHAVEDVGLLKYDFLGIKNLSILSDAIHRVKEDTGETIDVETIPVDDEKTFTMLAAGETEGTFQLNGSGMTRYLKELRPTTIHDINAMVALYRPGPMETIPAYIERKKNPKLIRYLDERMKEYLGFSYGLLVYQDDVLLTAITLGGYSWLEADVLRKAMGKKIPAEMERQKAKLLKGFEEYGHLSKEKGHALWKLIEPFAAYGFNKAHAASYGRVAYQTAYMKANHPVEYMAALLTADAGDTDEISILVAECVRLGMPVLPPDVNESGSVFTVVDAPENIEVSEKAGGKTIRFGLSSIKNFGEGISQAILEERTNNGAYSDISDFLSRVGSRSLNRKSLESLVKAGALDHLGERGLLLANIEPMLVFHREMTTEAPQESLFGALATPIKFQFKLPADNVTLTKKLEWEKELLGIYISGHPLDAHTETTAKSKLTIEKILAEPHPGMPIILPVLISEVRVILTKSGEKMAFVRFEDKTGNIEGVVFPKLFKEHAPLITTGVCMLVKGNISNRNGEISIAIDGIKGL